MSSFRRLNATLSFLKISLFDMGELMAHGLHGLDTDNNHNPCLICAIRVPFRGLKDKIN